MSYFTITEEQLNEMFKHYIERRHYKQNSTGEDAIWAGGECEEAEKWLKLFGVDLDYFRIEEMIHGEREIKVFDSNDNHGDRVLLPHFYGKNCNYAFPSNSTYTSSLYAKGKIQEKMLTGKAYFPDVDSSILWALYQVFYVYSLTSRSTSDFKEVCIQAGEGKYQRSIFSIEALLKDAWKTLTDIPIDPDEKTEVDWFIFPAGTDRETIWHWFDERYPKGVACLFGTDVEE